MSAPLRIRPPSNKAALAKDDDLKSYLDRLLKLIPAEAVSLYLVGNGIIPKEKTIAVFVWSAFCLVAVACIKAFGTADRVRSIPPDWYHVALSTIAFVIWVYSMGGPFQQIGVYEPYIGSLLILAFTFVVPYIYRGQPETLNRK